MPELMVVWEYDRIGRNIVVFISFEEEIIEIEYNAWIDTTEVSKEKLMRIRNWFNKKYPPFPIPESYKLNRNFTREYDLILNKTISKVNSLTFKDLQNETIYYL